MDIVKQNPALQLASHKNLLGPLTPIANTTKEKIRYKTNR